MNAPAASLLVPRNCCNYLAWKAYVRRFVAVTIIALTAGCVSTPQGSVERDAEAKQFASSPGNSTLFIYRPDNDSLNWDTVLWINGKLIGATLPRTFFRVNVVPGTHTITGMGHDNGKLTLETRDGELYFVSVLGVAGNSLFWQVPAEIGRRAINRCCGLMENWAPGQRPLLR
jgi:hypothetical protein